MTTKIPYQAQPAPLGPPAYAVFFDIQIALRKPNAPRTKRLKCIIDSGASSCLFHADLAKFLGLDLTSGVLQMTNGIGGPEEIWLHDITLYIPGGPVQITAGFKDGLSLAGLLGMNGFFEHFTVTFDSAAQQCRLERLYKA